MNDLWPENLEVVEPEANGPIMILEEQASFLGSKTQNLVTAEVGKPAQFRGELQYPFYLVAPQLDNYRYLLFSVTHDILSPYPVDLLLDEDIMKEIAPRSSRATVPANTEPEFVDLLKKVLQSAKTRQIINSLIAQSNQFIARTGKSAKAVSLG